MPRNPVHPWHNASTLQYSFRRSSATKHKGGAGEKEKTVKKGINHNLLLLLQLQQVGLSLPARGEESPGNAERHTS